MGKIRQKRLSKEEKAIVNLFEEVVKLLKNLEEEEVTN